MTTRLTFPASMFSVVCQRCGSTLRKNADSCPNCGADRAAAFGEERKKERAPERGSERLSLFKPAGEPAADPAASVAGPSETAPVPASQPGRSATSAELGFELGPDPDVLPDSEGWNRRKSVIAGVCAFALIAGGVAYMQHDNTDEDAAPSEQHSVSGAIDAKDAKSGGYAQSRSLPATPSAPPVAAVEKKPQVEERPMSVADTVLAARSAMEQHDLTAARNRVKSLTPPQQVRPDVQRLKDELAQRELERDAALQLARACEKTSAWACVQQNAGEALALDGSNTESQAMLERVIAHAGWLAGMPPLAKKKPAPDIASVAPPPVVTTPPAAPPAPAVQAATPPAKVAVAKPAPASVAAPVPVPVPVQQKPVVAVARAPAATATETHTAPPARESRRSATYARNTQTQTPATSTAKVVPAPAISPPVLATPPVTASVRSTTTPLATTTTTVAPAPSPATLPAATTPPVTTATVRSATPAPAPAPSYAAVPTPTPTTTRPAPAATTTATTTTTTPTPATVTHTAAATYGASGATETRPATRASLSDGTNPDELERAIKQFGWSGGDTMPKPSR